MKDITVIPPIPPGKYRKMITDFLSSGVHSVEIEKEDIDFLSPKTATPKAIALAFSSSIDYYGFPVTCRIRSQSLFLERTDL